MEKQTVLEKLEQLEKTHESRQSKTKLQHDIGTELQIHFEIQYGSFMNHLLNFIVYNLSQPKLCPTPVLLFLGPSHCPKSTNYFHYFIKVVERNV